MKKQLTRIAPLKAGIVLAILYGLLSLVVVPFLLLGLTFSQVGGKPQPTDLVGFGFVLLLPVLYGIAGFIFGMLGAAIYNLVAKWTGGLEFEVRDLPVAS